MNKDVILNPNDNNDLVIYQGDFFVAFSDQQHIAHIVEADTGQVKQYPLLGFGIRRHLNGQINGAVKRQLQLQLQSDGHQAQSIVYKDGRLKIEI